MSKIYESTLKERLNVVTEGQLVEVQSGFRKGRGVQDHIFTTKYVIEKVNERKTNTCIVFLSLEKGFDRVVHKKYKRV